MKQNLNLTLCFMLLILCSFSFSGAEAPDSAFLRYHQITFKASHNSYERDETIAEQLTFNPSQPYNDGCLGIEFDIHRHSSRYVPYRAINPLYFTVHHDKGNKGGTLAHHLDEVKAWHDLNPNHPPVLITIDIKSENGGYDNFHFEIDTYLKMYFEESLIFKPSQLLYNPSLSLAQNVIATGWPKISDSSMRGKFIICLSGNPSWKTLYGNSGVSHRYCFSDQDRDDNKVLGDDNYVGPPSSGNFVFFNFNVHHGNRDKWLEAIPLYYLSNFITRAWLVNSKENFNNCIRAKVSAIATDKIRNHTWAKVSDTEPCLSKITPPLDKRTIKNVENDEYRADHATEMQHTYESPNCDWIFEPQPGVDIYALRNAYNSEYLDCTITSMSSTINGNCQRWRLIPTSGTNRFFVQNVENGEYLTKKASKLADHPLSHEIHILQPL